RHLDCTEADHVIALLAYNLRAAPFLAPPFLAARVFAAFFAEADLAAAGRAAEALPPRGPPILPPFFAGALLTFLPRPEPPGCLPPPVISLTVAHARRSASSSCTPRSS